MQDTDDTGCQQGPEAASFSQAPPLARRLRALILESDLREVTEGLSPAYCVTSGKTLNLPGEQFPHRKSRANWEDDSPQIKLLSDTARQWMSPEHKHSVNGNCRYQGEKRGPGSLSAVGKLMTSTGRNLESGKSSSQEH